MKKILLSAAAVAAFASAAVAADLPSRRAPPVYVPPPVPVFTWTGFYGGFNAGADFNGYTDYALFGNTAPASAALTAGARAPFFDTRSTGFAGGAQIGYNFQIDGGLFGSTFGAIGSGLSPVVGQSYGGIVAGVEADADALTNKKTGTFLGVGTNQATIYRSKTDFVGTVRGRLGYAFGNVYVYGTGGFAYGGVRDNITSFNAAGVNDFLGSINKIQTGYAYGGGVEYAIPTASFINFFHSSAVTVKAEFIHYDLSATNALVASQTGTANSFTTRIHNDGNIARLGVNYKFGSPAAPVVARY